PPESYILSLHDALPISASLVGRSPKPRSGVGKVAVLGREKSVARVVAARAASNSGDVGTLLSGPIFACARVGPPASADHTGWRLDRKSTRLNSSHLGIS